MPGIASAATAVLIGHIGAGTSTIRIGAGGIMLPNHAPLQVAEQFGTLASLFPGRDRSRPRPRARHRSRRRVRAAPHAAGESRRVSTRRHRADRVLPRSAARPTGARGSRRRPATCRSGFLARACSARRSPRRSACRSRSRRTSRRSCCMRRSASIATASRRRSIRSTPYVMLGVNVVAADTDAEARFLASSGRQSFASLRAGRPISCRRRRRNGSAIRRTRTDPTNQTRVSFVGAPATIKDQIDGVRRADQSRRADRRSSHIYDHAARLHSYELAAKLSRELSALH